MTNEKTLEDYQQLLAQGKSLTYFESGHMNELWVEKYKLQADKAQQRLNRAYSERAIASVLFAKMALCLGYAAGVGKDDNHDWDDCWRVVLYVDLPEGQISWHIAPNDQHLLAGLPEYKGKWDGKFTSRDDEFVRGLRYDTPYLDELFEV